MSTDNSNSISLNKYIGDSGVCSRREADKIIDAQRVTINGVIAKKGNRVAEGDVVEIDGTPLQGKEAPIYLAFNKPPGITCTGDKDVEDNIIDFINYPKRIFYVGRIDKYSQGLIFLTNDGDVVNKILRAGNQHEKEYLVTVNKPVTNSFIQNMANGVPILDTRTNRCFVQKESNYTFRIILTQGLNRQIRRMCEYFGYHVTRLIRLRIMHIELGNLPEGEWRNFSKQEVDKLMRLVANSENLSQKMKLQKTKNKRHK
ncbi:MAG: 23S rRNA pseudouridine(2604) synthase RluF [Saprospiraceae bacterium]